MFQTAVVGASYGFSISWFSITVALLCVVGVAAILLSVQRSLHDELFSLYMGYLLFTAFALMIQALQRFLPLSRVQPYYIVVEVILGVTIATQWFVHVGTLFFLFEPSPTMRVRRVLLLGSGVSLCLLAIWIAFLVAERPAIGEIVTEVLLVALFAGALMLQSTSVRQCLGFRSQFYLRGRPSLRLWCWFCLSVHAMFCVVYAVRDLATSVTEAGACMYVLGDTLYYAVYPMVLVAVVRVDSAYWKQNGALLQDMRAIMEDDVSGVDAIDRVGEFALIPWRSLVFREKIGTGGYSEVYRAEWEGAPVAVKVLRVANTQLETLNELIAEARFMQQLRHDNICALLGVAMRGAQPTNEPLQDDASDELAVSARDALLCVVLQYCGGGSLFSRLHGYGSRRAPPLALVSILRDICAGMAYLHRKGAVHRDLKTPNVLLTDDGRALVSDFGLSRNNVQSAVTMTVIGTPHYMAPEMLRGERCDNKADVWSFGVIVWECMTRTVPYAGVAAIQVMHGVAHEGLRLQLAPVTEAAFPPLLGMLFRACLNDTPAARPTFADMAEQLNNTVH